MHDQSSLTPLILSALFRLSCLAACLVPLAAAAAPVVIPNGQAREVTVELPAAVAGSGLHLDPGGPFLKATLNLDAEAQDLALADGNAYIAAGADGLLVASLANGAPRLLAHLALEDGATRVRADQDIALLAGRRGLSLIDIHDPAAPRLVSRYGTDAAPIDAAIHGDRVYVLLPAELQVLDLGRPAAPRLLGRYPLAQPAHALAVHGDRVYLAGGDAGLIVLEAGNPSAIASAAGYRTTGPALDLAVDGDQAYLATGEGGLTVLDLTAPDAPRWLAGFARIGTVTRITAGAGQALVAGPGGQSYLLDVRKPAQPRVTARLRMLEPAAGLRLAGASAWALSGRRLLGIDLAPPAPQLGNEGLDLGQGVNLGGQRRVYIEGDIAYVADWFSGIHLYDISDPGRPRVLSSFHTDGSPKGIVVRDGYAFVADDDHGLQIIDVRDARHPQRVAQLQTPGLAYTPVLDGDRLYLAVHRGGFVIVDVKDVHAPRLLGHFDTEGKSWSIRVRGHIAYVADDSSGLLVFDVSDPGVPHLIGHFSPGGDAEEVLLDGERAYVAFFDGGVYVLDIHDPRAPVPLAHLDTPGNARGLALRGGRLYVADWLAGVHVVDVSDADHPAVLGSYDTDGAAWGVGLKDDYALVMDWWGGITVLDVRDPQRPRLAGRYPRRDSVEQIAVSGRYALVAAGGAGLQVFDIKNPLNPTWVTGIDLPAAHALALLGTRAYVINAGQRIAAVEVSNPFQAAVVDSYTWPRPIRTLRAAGNRLLLSDAGGVYLLDPRSWQWQKLPVDAAASDLWYEDGRIFIAAGAQGLLVTTPAVGASVTRYDAGAAVERVRAVGPYVYLQIANEGLRIAVLAPGGLDEAARIPLALPVDDIEVAADTLYVVTARSEVYAIDVSAPRRWRVQTRYQTMSEATGITVQDATLYLAGADTMTALEALPATAVAGPDQGRVRLAVPATLAPGSYDLWASDSGADPAPERLLLRDAVRMAPLHFGKPKITPEQFKALLQRQREENARQRR